MTGAGRYRVCREIGRGGMAEVLEAVAVGAGGFERRVALKRILPEAAKKAATVQMFLDEARIASFLHHAGIVGILDYGIADGVPFQVLELVDGVDCKQLLQLARENTGAYFPVDLALHITAQVGHALAYAHAAVDGEGRPLGIVHRDVKPGNILVTWAGDVMLADFGIAFAHQRRHATQAGVTKGTARYMAPEQTIGADVDARADVFALGCVLHALITGSSPLAGPADLAHLVRQGALDLDLDGAELPTEVAQIVDRATRRDRGERFQCAGDLATEVGSVLARRRDRDVKTALIEWTAKLRAPAQAPEGQLDQLLDLELVLGASADEVRRFTVERTAPQRAPTPAPQRAPTPAPQHPPTPAPQHPPTPPPPPEPGGALATVGAVVALCAAVVLAVSVFVWARPETTSPDAPLAPVERRPEPEVSPPAAELPAPPPIVSPPPAAPSTTRRRAPAAPQSKPKAPAPALERGTLLIGGAGAHRAEIVVDGDRRGWAPKRLDLPVGEHTVLLRRADGTERGPKVIEIEETHTPSRPFKWLVP